LDVENWIPDAIRRLEQMLQQAESELRTREAELELARYAAEGAADTVNEVQRALRAMRELNDGVNSPGESL
jgi:Arc/MetJ-type ribon-helix-helix transcriptional regulator